MESPTGCLEGHEGMGNISLAPSDADSAFPGKSAIGEESTQAQLRIRTLDWMWPQGIEETASDSSTSETTYLEDTALEQLVVDAYKQHILARAAVKQRMLDAQVAAAAGEPPEKLYFPPADSSGDNESGVEASKSSTTEKDANVECGPDSKAMSFNPLLKLASYLKASVAASSSQKRMEDELVACYDF